MDIKAIVTSFDACHIYRSGMQEWVASAHNPLPLDAANRPKVMGGWFAKGGIDDTEDQALRGLYKTQAGQLADYLDLQHSTLSSDTAIVPFLQQKTFTEPLG